MTDDELMVADVAGDATAFEALYRRYERRVSACQPFAAGALVATAGGAVAASFLAGLAEHGFTRRAPDPVY